MIILALATGLRQGELLGLQWADINVEKRFLMVRHNYFRGRMGSPKSNKKRIVPLNPSTMDALLELKRHPNGFVFFDEKGNPLTDQKCKWPMIRACRVAGLRQISWHVLRHTFASHLVQNGVSIMVVQKYLGHADVRTTQRYSHLNPDLDHSAVDSLPSYRTYIAQNVIPFRKCAES